jgi:ankyrin repeat protein
MGLNEVLLKAVEKGHRDFIELLIRRGADVNATSSNGFTPLHYAAYNGHADVVKLFLENGADPSIKDNSGKTAADIARERGHVDIASMIENIKELFEALKKGDVSKAEKLLSKLSVPNARDRDGVALLHWATFLGYAGIIRFLVEKGADVNIKDRNGNTPLHWAAANGQVKIADLLIRHGADVNARDELNCTPLHYAAKHGHPEVARLLIEKGSDVNARSKGGWTPLHVAAGNGHADVTELLIQYGADTNAKCGFAVGIFYSSASREAFTIPTYTDAECREFTVTLLHIATAFGRADVVRLLLKHGADVNARSDLGTPLCWAALFGRAEIAKILLEHGADVNAKHSECLTPLHLAAFSATGIAEYLIKKSAYVSESNKYKSSLPITHSNYAEVAKVLLEYGAEINAKACAHYRCLGDVPLHWAVFSGNAEIVKLLVERGVDANARTKDGFTPLHLAALSFCATDNIEEYRYIKSYSHFYPFSFHVIQVAEFLIKMGADVNARANDGSTPLEIALTKGKINMAALLVKYGARIDAQRCWTALLSGLSQRAGHRLSRDEERTVTDFAKLLIKNGANVDVKLEYYNKTPLHIFASIGNSEMVEFLIKSGADVNARDFFGDTPLHEAARYGFADIVRLLLVHGAYVNAKDELGDTPLHNAGSREVAELLIRYGADVNAKNEKGETPLHLKAAWGWCAEAAECVELLIRKGADVNAKNEKGETPLYYSARWWGCVGVIELLIRKGADINVRCNDDLLIDHKLSITRGLTPLHVAAARGDVQAVKLLLENGGDVNSRTGDGQTPLHLAAYAGRIDVVELLLEKGADVNARATQTIIVHEDMRALFVDYSGVAHGWTPLHYAVAGGDVLTAMLLLMHGADVNARSWEGVTPLHIAASLGDAEIVKVLLENGADPNVRDRNGETALDIARKKVSSERWLRDRYIEILKIIEGFATKSKRTVKSVDSSRGVGRAVVTCPYCGKPAYRLGTLGKYYCFNCKRYV